MSTIFRTWLGALTALIFLPGTSVSASDQATFDSPHGVVEHFIEALRDNDNDQVRALFGEQARTLIEVTDKAAQAAERKVLYQVTQQMWRLREDSDTERTLIIGSQAWPLPFPIVKLDGAWQFDTQAGLEEIVDRRIGKHELAVIDISKAYVTAQAEYADRDRDADQVLEFAQRFRSTAGKRDGLYWRTGQDEVPSPAGPFIAEYRDYLEGRETGDPMMGYYFRVLTNQGDHAPGSAYDNIINGNMIAGFAMVAFPADYGSSGIMTFIVSHQGRVFEKDLGNNTSLLAATMLEYNHDERWVDVTD